MPKFESESQCGDVEESRSTNFRRPEEREPERSERVESGPPTRVVDAPLVRVDGARPTEAGNGQSAIEATVPPPKQLDACGDENASQQGVDDLNNGPTPDSLTPVVVDSDSESHDDMDSEARSERQVEGDPVIAISNSETSGIEHDVLPESSVGESGEAREGSHSSVRSEQADVSRSPVDDEVGQSREADLTVMPSAILSSSELAVAWDAVSTAGQDMAESCGEEHPDSGSAGTVLPSNVTPSGATMLQIFDGSEPREVDVANEPITVHAEENAVETVGDVEGPSDDDEVFPNVASDASLDRFAPFPVERLPQPLRAFVTETASSIGCDPTYPALSALTVAAGAIGNTHRLQLKLGWRVPAILWTAFVGNSGTQKSPAFNEAMAPVYSLEAKAAQRHEQAAREEGSAADMLGRRSYVVSDTTFAALCSRLQANRRGLLASYDELRVWFDSLKRDRGGNATPAWLSMHGGGNLNVTRKSGRDKDIYVQDAAVSICGGIQPKILKRVLSDEHRESGLAARFLVAWPPPRRNRWTEQVVTTRVRQQYHRIVKRLYLLEPSSDDGVNRRPVMLELTDDAKQAWIQFYDQHASQNDDLEDEHLEAAWSKLEEVPARLALVIHCVRMVAEDQTLESDDHVDLASMEAGIVMTEWFKHETRRVYSQLNESDASRDRRRLIEWLRPRGGPVSPRDVQQNCRWLRPPGTAERALQELVDDGYGQWVSSPSRRRGPRPRRFRLLASSTVNGIRG